MHFTELSMSHLAGYRLINERGELTFIRLNYDNLFTARLAYIEIVVSGPFFTG